MEWEAHRPAVFGAAYRLLGGVAEAARIAEVFVAAADRVYLELPFFPRTEEKPAA